MTTMLQLVQQATAEMGLAVPTYVAGNTAQDVIQQLALLNSVGYELQREYTWQGLDKEYRFTTQYLTTTGTVALGSPVVTAMAATTGLDSTYQVSGVGVNQDTYVVTNDSSTQVTLSQNCTASASASPLYFGKTKYTLPSDYDQMIDKTQFDKSKRWSMLGPETAQQWQFLKSSYISTGPRLRFRIMGGYFQIWPFVSTSEYIGFEYFSKYWASDVSSNGKGSFTVDTDTCIYPDRLMVAGLKLKYFEVKGFDTTAFARVYQGELDRAKTADGGSATLSMAPRLSEVLIGYENIPDGTIYGQ